MRVGDNDHDVGNGDGGDPHIDHASSPSSRGGEQSTRKKVGTKITTADLANLQKLIKEMGTKSGHGRVEQRKRVKSVQGLSTTASSRTLDRSSSLGTSPKQRRNSGSSDGSSVHSLYKSYSDVMHSSQTLRKSRNKDKDDGSVSSEKTSGSKKKSRRQSMTGDSESFVCSSDSSTRSLRSSGRRSSMTGSETERSLLELAEAATQRNPSERSLGDGSNSSSSSKKRGNRRASMSGAAPAGRSMLGDMNKKMPGDLIVSVKKSGSHDTVAIPPRGLQPGDLSNLSGTSLADIRQRVISRRTSLNGGSSIMPVEDEVPTPMLVKQFSSRGSLSGMALPPTTVPMVLAKKQQKEEKKERRRDRQRSRGRSVVLRSDGRQVDLPPETKAPVRGGRARSKSVNRSSGCSSKKASEIASLQKLPPKTKAIERSGRGRSKSINRSSSGTATERVARALPPETKVLEKLAGRGRSKSVHRSSTSSDKLPSTREAHPETKTLERRSGRGRSKSTQRGGGSKKENRKLYEVSKIGTNQDDNMVEEPPPPETALSRRRGRSQSVGTRTDPLDMGTSNHSRASSKDESRTSKASPTVQIDRSSQAAEVSQAVETTRQGFEAPQGSQPFATEPIDFDDSPSFAAPQDFDTSPIFETPPTFDESPAFKAPRGKPAATEWEAEADPWAKEGIFNPKAPSAAPTNGEAPRLRPVTGLELRCAHGISEIQNSLSLQAGSWSNTKSFDEGTVSGQRCDVSPAANQGNTLDICLDDGHTIGSRLSSMDGAKSSYGDTSGVAVVPFSTRRPSFRKQHSGPESVSCAFDDSDVKAVDFDDFSGNKQNGQSSDDLASAAQPKSNNASAARLQDTAELDSTKSAGIFEQGFGTDSTQHTQQDAASAPTHTSVQQGTAQEQTRCVELEPALHVLNPMAQEFLLSLGITKNLLFIKQDPQTVAEALVYWRHTKDLPAWSLRSASVYVTRWKREVCEALLKNQNTAKLVSQRLNAQGSSDMPPTASTVLTSKLVGRSGDKFSGSNSVSTAPTVSTRRSSVDSSVSGLGSSQHDAMGFESLPESSQNRHGPSHTGHGQVQRDYFSVMQQDTMAFGGFPSSGHPGRSSHDFGGPSRLNPSQARRQSLGAVQHSTANHDGFGFPPNKNGPPSNAFGGQCAFNIHQIQRQPYGQLQHNGQYYGFPPESSQNFNGQGPSVRNHVRRQSFTAVQQQDANRFGVPSSNQPDQSSYGFGGPSRPNPNQGRQHQHDAFGFPSIQPRESSQQFGGPSGSNAMRRQSLSASQQSASPHDGFGFQSNQPKQGQSIQRIGGASRPQQCAAPQNAFGFPLTNPGHGQTPPQQFCGEGPGPNEQWRRPSLAR